MLRRLLFASVCGLLLTLAGCPKRQSLQSTVVYVPAAPTAATPPPTPAAATTPPKYIVIEEPPPPPPETEPEELPFEQPLEPAARHKPKRQTRPETPGDQDQAPTAENPETPETPPAV